MRTTRICEKSLDPKNFQILKGRKFTVKKFPQLEEVYKNENTYVLYPSETAINLEQFRNLINQSETKTQELENNSNTFHVILIDGTWAQASGIFYTNLDLHNLKQVI